MSATKTKADLIQYARSLGFERFGVARAEPLDEAGSHLQAWISDGRAGSMRYMTERPERRARPEALLPGAQSVIALAMTYAKPDASEGAGTPLPQEGRVARYTYGPDYHRTIMKRLDSFTRYLEALCPGSASRALVDTGPLLERAIAQQAGIGFVGKNTMLITKALGSWVFLASVVTTVELPVDQPDDRSCGDCRLCMDACPTQAITEPYRLDARLCIAYLTIENRQAIPEVLRKKMGPWVFGCDICQEVCPHNSGRTPAAKSLSLREVLSLKTEAEFAERFSGSAMTRSGLKGLLRNACVASAQLKRIDLSPLIAPLAQDADPVLRETARWTLEQLRTI